MNESLVKYLAGLLDADGSLSFAFKSDQNRQDRYFVGLSMQLAASDAVDPKGWVESLPLQTGMGSICRSGNRKQFVMWRVSKRADLEMLLPRVIKHMVIKAKHWQWLLETWRDLRRGGYGQQCCDSDERERLSAESKLSRREKVGPLKPKNHPTWAWLAGYLDGDGCYSYRRHFVNGYVQWTIHVSAVAHVGDKLVLEFLQKAFGGLIFNQNDSVMVWRRALGYQNRAFAESLLPNLAKHSRLKRHKIEAILSHHRQRLSKPGVEKRYCSVDGCDSPAHGHGLCSKHYQQERRKA